MSREHICVCVCTYKRPDGLRVCLDGLRQQRISGQFDFCVIVVDNDKDRSGESVARSFMDLSGIKVSYNVEPIQNISVARNRTLDLATGDYVAFIDDDECPGPDWLQHLHAVRAASNADGVIGFVQPRFDVPPPEWITKGHFFWKPRPPIPATGTRMTYGITSNALISRPAIVRRKLSFDPAFGLSGGEDTMFFTNFIDRGGTVVFSREAVIDEVIPAQRLSASYLAKRSHLQGRVFSRVLRLTRPSARWFRALLASVALLVYGGLLPLCVSTHVRVRTRVKLAWHLGFLADVLGLETLSERDQFEPYANSQTRDVEVYGQGRKHTVAAVSDSRE